MVRKAGRRTMAPIILAPVAVMSPHILDVAEFTITCLFQPWYPILIRPAEANLIRSNGLDMEAASFPLVSSAAERTSLQHTLHLGFNWNNRIVHQIYTEFTCLYFPNRHEHNKFEYLSAIEHDKDCITIAMQAPSP